ncbi:hypothetical protein SEUCBS139899_010703 [Sporothrix eucalyptigena]|uniref:Uncharacterized protein n=1 Tax=Sporothrix eucalyptigena TaxID=1812306 RepID=A0ABP0D461_9PEZI
MRLINHDAVVFHRVGGLHLTTRFKEEGLPIISENDWKAGSKPADVTFTNGTSLSTTVPVREFIPRYGDVTGRRYTDAHGNHHWIDLPAYGLTDPAAYAILIRDSIPGNTFSWAAAQGRSHQEAIRLIRNGAAPELEKLLQYDFGRFQKTSSSYITGTNRLGIEALPSNTATMPAQAPLPRMITAQSDIMLSEFLAELLKQLFGNGDGLLLKRLMTANPPSTHIAYVALRIIVEGTIWVLIDKERRDAQNNTNDYSLQVQLQDSLNTVLHTFSNSRQGMPFSSFKRSLDSTALAYYDGLAEDDSNTLPSPAWKDNRFWLPSISELTNNVYEAKNVFRLA